MTYKPRPRRPIILVFTITSLTLVTIFNWHFDALSRQLLNDVRSDVTTEGILDIFSIPATARAVQYSDECFTNTSMVLDSRGRPCIDFNFAARRQGIYAVNTSEATYVYCSIPKNGCSYHLGLMQRLLGHEYRTGRSVHSNTDRVSVSGDALKQMMFDQNIPKYFVVRNPLERVLSAYLDKIERPLPLEERTADRFEKWVFDTIHPGMEHDFSTNVHWRPQISMCGFGMRDLWREFRWFKVEEPAEYVDFLERLLPERVLKDGWNDKWNTSFRDAVLGPKQRTGHTSERFFKYVRTPQLFDYLVSCYAMDIDGLGYTDEVRRMRERLLQQNP